MKITQSPALLSDEHIISLYHSRDESAITETDRKYGRYLYTVAFNILFDQEDSKECVNDTYLKTWNAIPPALPQVFKSFLSKIIRNTAIDRFDEAKRQKRVPAELCESLEDFEGFLPSDSDVENTLLAKQIGQIISDYLDSVSVRKQYIFVSRYYFLVPTAQIAKKLHISQSAVQKTLSSMKAALRQRLEEGGIDL